MTFYNTISESQRLQNVYHSQTVTQEQKIMKCFEQYERPLSPSMVLSLAELNCPITSIRRAMTNLSDDGKLEKTKDFVMGNYGKREHLWCLPKKQESFSQSTLPF